MFRIIFLYTSLYIKKQMKKYLSILAALALSGSCCGLGARELGSSEALSRALDWQKSSGQMMRKAPATSGYSLKYTAEAGSVSRPAFYVFAPGEEGFIVVSADDRLPAVLGYSDSGGFDYDSIPENLKWWLEQYRREIDFFLSTPSAAVRQTPAIAGVDRKIIDPLMTTKWNQDAPYNNSCPMDTYGRCYTGCVATAIAQIINKNRWPEKGVGYHSYTWKEKTLEFDYANTTFSYDNLLDEYDENSPGISNRAVSTLMYACGVGVNMQYSTTGSGAYDPSVLTLLIDFMDYDPQVQLCYKDNYSMQDWQDAVYEELANNRPVYYSGVTANRKGGHAFVCDGYAGNDYFHFNWGWGGVSDGNFLLNALNPHDQGIGSSSGGYNTEQSIITGIMKNTGRKAIPNIYCEGTFTRSSEGFTLTKIYNYSSFDAQFNLGILVESEEDGSSVFFNGIDVEEMSGFDVLTLTLGYIETATYNAVPSGLKAGNYMIYPAQLTQGTEPRRIRYPVIYQQGIALRVNEDGTMVYGEEAKETEQLSVVDFKPLDEVVDGVTARYIITVRNDGTRDLTSYPVTMRVTDAYGYLLEGTLKFTLKSGESISNYVEFMIEGAKGTCEANFFDGAGAALNEKPFTFEVLEKGSDIPDGLTVKDISTDRFYKGFDQAFNVTFHYEGTQAYPAGFNAVISNPSDGQTVYSVGYEYTFQAAQSCVLTLPSFNPQLPAGTYQLLFTDRNGEPLSDPFTVYSFENVDGLWYGIRDGSSFVAVSPADSYSGGESEVIAVPSEVTLNGTVYKVTSLEAGCFRNAAGVKAFFLNIPECPFSSAGDIFEGVSTGVEFYVNGGGYAGYNSVLASAGYTVYSIIDHLEYKVLSGNLSDFSVGQTLELSLDFVSTGSEGDSFVNPAVVIISDESRLRIDKGEFDGGSMPLTLTALGEGEDEVQIISAQPGDRKTLIIPVDIKNGLSGIENTGKDTVKVKVAHGTVTVTGLEEDTLTELYSAQGMKVASRRAVNGTVIFRPGSAGEYVITLPGGGVKIRL